MISKTRYIVYKSLIYRMLSFFIQTTIVFYLTRNWRKSINLGISVEGYKLIFYYIFERLSARYWSLKQVK